MMIKNIALSLLFTASSISFAASNIHIVSKGESLYGIAAQYHTSIKTLTSLNKLSSSNVMAGQKLRIPTKSGIHVEKVVIVSKPASAIAKKSVKASGAIHIVKKGETLSTIAANYGLGLSQLSRYNHLSLHKAIQAGQKIRLPGSARSVSESAVVSAPVTKTARYKYVRPSESASVPALSVAAPVMKVSTRNVQLESSSAMVVDAETGKVLYSKNIDEVKSIASITKLMTAMVTLDGNLAMDETISIDEGDVDHLKHTTSRLPVGTHLTRYDMLRLALMSSENRAASALSHNYPGGQSAFIQAMNAKAKSLGMDNTSFSDPTGLTPRNVSTAADLVKMVEAASHYDLIHKFTTTEGREVAIRPRSAPLKYLNTNLLVRKGQWDILVSKTGYITEAGRCLVMKAEVANRPALMVFLESNGKYSPVGDATRIKKWIESGAAGVTVASL